MRLMKRDLRFLRYEFANAWAVGIRFGPWEFWVELSKKAPFRTKGGQE